MEANEMKENINTYRTYKHNIKINKININDMKIIITKIQSLIHI